MFRISMLIAAFLSSTALSQAGGPPYPVYAEATKSLDVKDRVTGLPLPEPTGAWAYDVSVRNENNRAVFCPNASFLAYLDFYLEQCSNPRAFGHSVKFGNRNGGLFLQPGERLTFAKVGDNERYAKEKEQGNRRLEYCDRNAAPLDCGFSCENGRRIYGEDWMEPLQGEGGGYRSMFCSKNGISIVTEIYCDRDKKYKPGDSWPDKYFVNGKRTFYCQSDGRIMQQVVCDDGTDRCVPTSTCPSGTTDLSQIYPQGLPRQQDLTNRPVCGLSGTIKGHVLLTAKHVYLLNPAVTVGNDVSESSLTIEPGTTIRAGSGGSSLVVTRGSKIFASGTEKDPIVFAGFESSKNPGRWFGLVINGRSTLNTCSPNSATCTGKSAYGYSYGGKIPGDSSGILSYVNILNPGNRSSMDSAPEIGGLTLNSVGSGTKVDHIQVQNSADDGIRIFGGTVNLKHIVIDGFYDDGLDWEFGWTGKAQYVLINNRNEGNDGVEGGNAIWHDRNLLPRSNPTLANFTIMSSSRRSGTGLYLHAGTGVSIYNSIVTGFSTYCVALDQIETFTANAIKMEGVVAKCTKTLDDRPTNPYPVSEIFSKSGLNTVADPLLTGYSVLSEDSPAFYTFIDLPKDGFFSEEFFAGAVETFTGSSGDWTRGWTFGPRDERLPQQ